MLPIPWGSGLEEYVHRIQMRAKGGYSILRLLLSVFDRSLRLTTEGSLRERDVRFLRMTVKRVLGWGTLNCLWRGSPTIGPTSFFSPPAQLCAVTCVNNWNIVVCNVMELIQQHHAYHSWQLKLDLVFASVYYLKITLITMQVEKNSTCTYKLKGEGFFSYGWLLYWGFTSL